MISTSTTPTLQRPYLPLLLSLFAIITLTLLAAPTHAAILAKYDFNNFTSPTDARTAYPTITRGAYVNNSQIRKPVDPDNLSYLVLTVDPYNYTNTWDGNVMEGRIRSNPAGAGVYITNDATAITRDSWFAVTFTPGQLTSFTSITLDAAAFVIDPGGEFEDVYDVGMVLRSSLTGFTQNDALGEALITAGMQTGEKQQITFDLSNVAALQNITEPVTFRFYMNTNGDNLASPFYIDNLTLNGVAVPEPTVPALFALGATTLLLRRRRAA